MRKFRLIRKLLICLALAAVVLPLVLFGGGFVLRAVLHAVFADGTGCTVELGNPALRLFPARGEIDDVAIRCAGEGSGEGFFARKVSVAITLSDLFTKNVSLVGLKVDGARAVSASTESAFFKTIEFIVEPPLPKPPAWHDFLTAGWKVVVDTVTINGAGTDQAPELVLRFNGAEAAAAGVRVFIVDHGKLPSDLEASARTGRITTGGITLPLGTIDLISKAGRGLFEFKSLAIRPPYADSRVDASGKILFGEHPTDDLKVSGRLSSDFVTANLSDVSRFFGPTAVQFSGSLTGPFETPTFAGRAEVQRTELENATIAACIAPAVAVDLEVSAEELIVRGLQLGKLISTGEFRMQFAGDLPFRTDVRTELSAGYAEALRCLAQQQSAPPNSGSEALTDLLSDALNGSTVEAAGSGNLRPPDASFTLKSRLYPAESEQSSDLRVSARVTEQTVSAEITEELSRKAAPRGLRADLTYDLQQSALRVKQLSLESYPAVHLLARAVPFLPAAAARTVSRFLSSETTLDGKAAGNIASGASNGGGNFRFSHLLLPGNDDGSFSVKVDLHGDNVRLSDIVLSSGSDPLPALRAEGQAVMKAAGEIEARVNLNRFDLSALPSVRENLPSLNGILGGQFLLSGTFLDPKYEGALSIDTPLPGGDVGVLRSDFKINGDKKALAVDGALFNARGEVHLHLPFAANSRLSLTLISTDLPLSFVTAADRRFETAPDAPGEPAEVVKLADSVVSARLDYRGPARDPLLGAGKLQVDRIKLVGTELNVKERRPLLMRIENGRIVFESVSLLANDHELRLTGYADRHAGWNAAVTGEWEIASVLGGLEAFSGFEQVSGIATANVFLRGPLNEPALNGSLNLRNGVLAVALGDSIVDASHIEIDTSFSSGNLLIDRVSARAGDGTISGRGRFNSLLDAPEGQLNLELKGIVLEPFERLVVTVGGDLALSKHGSSPFVLEGSIELAEGSYENNIDLLRMVRTITRTIIGLNAARTEQRTVKQQTGRDEKNPVNLRLHITSEAPIVVETNVVQAALRVDLSALGSAAQPTLNGMVEATDGTFALQSDVFEIVTGQIQFADPSPDINPRLNIVGESTIEARSGEEHRVRMSVKGTLQRPLISFTSDSGLSENQIVGLLGRGKQGAGGLTVLKDTGERYGLIELLNPGSGLTLRERLSGLTGFSEVQIDPAFSSTSGDFTPRVIAKRPLPADLNLRLESELAGEQGSEARVERPLTFQTNLFAGWKTSSATNSAQGNTGALNFGIRYSTDFPGISLFPQKMEDEER